MKIDQKLLDRLVTILIAGGLGGGFFWMMGKAIDAKREKAAELAAYRRETVDSKDILGDINRASLENENLSEENQVHAKALLMESKASLDRASSIQGVSDAIGRLYDRIQEFSGGLGSTQNSHVRWAWEQREKERERVRIAEEKAEARRLENERMARLEKTVLSGISMLKSIDN